MRSAKCVRQVSLMVVLVTAAGMAAAREYGDILMDSTRPSMEKAGVKAVSFPHWFHRIRYKCKVCHESLFVMQKGANNVTMRRIMEGEACGTCHNGVIAWEPLYCDRCHGADFQPAAAAPVAPLAPLAPAAPATASATSASPADTATQKR